MADNGIKVMNPNVIIAPAVSQPKRIPPPAQVDNGRPLPSAAGATTITDATASAATTEATETTATETPVVAVAETEETARAKRKEEWNLAEKARQMEASANDKLKKAQAYEDALANFNKDPTELAKMLGIPLSDLLIKLQNAAFAMPTEKVVSPEEDLKLKAMKYEQDMQDLKRQQEDLKNTVIRTNYINSKIMPALTKDPDKYELLHANGVDNTANFVFDYIAQQYKETGKEWPVEDVLQVYQEEMIEKTNTFLNNAKKLKTFKKQFSAEELAEAVAEAAGTDAKKIEKAKLETSTGETDLSKLVTPRGGKKPVKELDNTVVPAKSPMTREARLAAMRTKAV